MGSIGAPELIVLFLLGLVLWMVIRWVRKTAEKGAARIARQERSERDDSEPPPRPKKDSAAKHVERHVEREKIIERQVLVMHCRYCKELTPADLSECKSCGARLK